MGFVKLSLFICACLAIQVQSKVLPQTNEGVRSAILDLARAALNALQDAVNTALAVAEGTINGIGDTIAGIQAAVLGTAKQQIHNIVDVILKQLDQLKEDASKAGVVIVDCTEGQEELLKQLPVTVLNDTSACVAAKVDDAMHSVSQILTEIRSTNEEVKKLTQKLDKCGDGLTSVVCISQVMADIGLATAQLPAKIAQDVLRAKAMVDALPAKLALCVTDKIVKLQQEATDLFNGMSECIQDKMSGGSSNTTTAAPPTSGPTTSAPLTTPA